MEGGDEIMGILSTLKKNRKLNSIMKRLGQPSSLEGLVEEIYARAESGQPSESEIAETELLDLVCGDPDTRAILDHFGATREEIEEIYRCLAGMGLGVWVRGNYVAAASVALKPTLIYVLESTKSPLPDGWAEKDRWVKIRYDLLRYFESGKLGSVTG